jgi:hypothetical protein
MEFDLLPKGYTYSWQNLQNIESHNYKCSFCGNSVASEKGWTATSPYSGKICGAVFICHFCKKATFFDDKANQYPGTVFGNIVKDIPEKSIEELYDEARKATSLNCYTASVLSCRKLLMHIAVAKGADENKSFAYYVDYLASKNFIPPDAQQWVDHIRLKGNEANHEIKIMDKDDAEELLTFIEMLLKVIYEFPAKISKKINPVA